MWPAFALLLVLLVLSLLKDQLTPDYRNTPTAAFLDPTLLKTSRIGTLLSHPIFWIKAVLYTIAFVALPSFIIHLAFKQINLTRFTFTILTLMAVTLYVTIFINSATLDHVLVSKVNRYLHSPIITLFLWAAYKLTQQSTEHAK